MSTTGSAIKDHIQVLGLDYDKGTDTYAWAVKRRIWAAAEQDTRSNLFSSVGVGARGVTFTIRRSPGLTLHNAFRWRGQFCFLTSLVDGDPGFQVVKAALCEPAKCQKDADMEPPEDPPGCFFPGILTEKYVGHEQLDPHAVVTGDFVLVTPKIIKLAPGSWVTVREPRRPRDPHQSTAKRFSLETEEGGRRSFRWLEKSETSEPYDDNGAHFLVRALHELDPYKNEYEIRRKEDC